MNHNPPHEEEVTTNKLRKFAIRHPKFRYFVDKLDSVFIVGLIVVQASLASTGLILSIMVIELFLQKYNLSLGYLSLGTISVTGILAVALPTFTWHQSRRHEIRIRAFTQWEPQAKELVALLCEITMKHSECQEQMYHDLGEFIFENKVVLHLYASPNLWATICDLYGELGIENSGKNIEYFAQKALNILRKEMGLSTDVFLIGSYLRKLDKQEVNA